MKFEDFLSFLKSIQKNPVSFSSFLLLFFVFLNLTVTIDKRYIKQKPLVLGEKVNLPISPLLPKNVASLPVPWLTAKAVEVIDSSGVTLFEKNPSEKLYPASTTKIMTALIALEAFLPDQILTVSQKYNDGQKIGLSIGEQLTADSLLKALLIASANDAAEVLAANYPGGRQAFINKMNNKAKELYLVNTHFVNPTGIDEVGQWTSAVDLSKLSKYALKNPRFAELVSTKRATISVSNFNKSYTFENINQLLGKLDGVRGIKTGYTNFAGECLVSAIERNGHLIYIVVLGSNDRFGETTKLTNWAFANFAWL